MSYAFGIAGRVKENKGKRQVRNGLLRPNDYKMDLFMSQMLLLRRHKVWEMLNWWNQFLINPLIFWDLQLDTIHYLKVLILFGCDAYYFTHLYAAMLTLQMHCAWFHPVINRTFSTYIPICLCDAWTKFTWPLMFTGLLWLGVLRIVFSWNWSKHVTSSFWNSPLPSSSYFITLSLLFRSTTTKLVPFLHKLT